MALLEGRPCRQRKSPRTYVEQGPLLAQRRRRQRPQRDGTDTAGRPLCRRHQRDPAGTVYVADSLDGPWKKLGTIRGERLHASNISIMVRPDGDYMIVPRSGQVFISKAADGILGPYRPTGPSAFPRGIPNLEDPMVFYSGNLYHIVVNSWSLRKAFHLTSKDGKSNWGNRGLAYDPTTDFCRYTDGTVNHWNKLERPGVVLENGHVIAMTFAVIDTPKESQRGNNGHGSKIIVIPFDGAALDRDLAKAAGQAMRRRPGNERCSLNNFLARGRQRAQPNRVAQQPVLLRSANLSTEDRQ